MYRAIHCRSNNSHQFSFGKQQKKRKHEKWMAEKNWRTKGTGTTPTNKNRTTRNHIDQFNGNEEYCEETKLDLKPWFI